MATLTAETGGFAWSTAWIPSGTTWDDSYAWADVASFEANPTTPLIISDAITVGDFSVVGSNINEGISERVQSGSFTTTTTDAGRGITELASGQFFSLGGQEINEKLLEVFDFGSFAFDGKAANKSISDKVVYGNFVFNGRPIQEAISERAEVGSFVLTGNAVNEALLENIDVANFNIDGQIVSKGVSKTFGTGEFFTNLSGIQYNEVWDDTAYWLDSDIWKDSDNVDIDITERGEVGVFSLAGQNHIKRITRIHEGETFSLTGLAALLRKPRYEYDNVLTTTSLLTGSPNSAVIILGSNDAIPTTTKNGYI